MKAKNRRIVFWTFIGIILSAIVAAMVIPPFINLNHMGPLLAEKVREQTGIEIYIRDGNKIRLSLLGRITLTAHDVILLNDYGMDYERATIQSVSFHIPFRSVFNQSNIAISSTIILNNPRLWVSNIEPANIPGRIVFNNGTITFRDITFTDINGVFRNNVFNGSVRTDGHRYTIETDGNFFVVTNPNIRLNMRGQIVTDATGYISARGNVSFNVPQVSRLPALGIPNISGRIVFESEFLWQQNMIRLYNISANTEHGYLTGDIEIHNDGRRRANIVADNANIDFTFIALSPEILSNSDISFSGNGQFIIPNIWTGNDTINANRIRARTRAIDNTIEIRELMITDDNININATGNITDGIAQNIDVQIQTSEFSGRCLLSGNIDSFSCNPWNYRDRNFSAYGTLSVGEDTFNLEFNSYNVNASNSLFFNLGARMYDMFGRDTGTVKFRLADDVHGTIQLGDGISELEFFNLRGTTLTEVPIRPAIISVLPDGVKALPGNINHAQITNNRISFIFEGDGWHLTIRDNRYFDIVGTTHFILSAFAPNMDLTAIADGPFRARGEFVNPSAQDIEIEINGNRIVGRFDGNAFDLHTEHLNIDNLLSQNFIDNYESLRFLTPATITLPFALGANIALSADRMTLRGESYNAFTYSMMGTTQNMSVTDSEKGNIILSLERRGINYNITVQLNRFPIIGTLLPDTARLNIADTQLSGRANMTTRGFTANDFRRNITGDMELMFDGGFLIGFGTDELYDNAQSISRTNGEVAISRALSGGVSRLQTLRIVGNYTDGLFRTTEPLSARTRHTEYSGHIQTRTGRIRAQIYVLLRGTSAAPAPIRVDVMERNVRDFSLSEIMRNFDPDFMREFTRIHDRF